MIFTEYRRESAGSFEPGLFTTAGFEYNLTNSLYIYFNARLLIAKAKITTLSEYSDSRVEQIYKVFYSGIGIGYEF